MRIRPETPTDSEAITAVTIAAFADHPFSQHTEQFIIQALRAAGALSLSMVAEHEGSIVGHIAFSPVGIGDGTPDWYGLGPVSVLPELQRQGIGSGLIREGLEVLWTKEAKGCALVGDPAFYSRFGFKNIPRLVHEGIPQEVFLCLPFTDHVPKGNVTFHIAFQAKG